MSKHPELPDRARVLLVGAGRVGTAVAYLLRESGCSVVGVASRTASTAQRAAEYLDAPVADLGDLPEADLVVIGAVDSAIAALGASVAASPSADARVLHLSGASGVTPLGSVTDAGGIAWALHPVQACPDIDTGIQRLPGSAWGVTVSGDLEGAIELIERRLKGTSILLTEEARPLWHAASVMTSNGISALMAFGEQILGSIGIEQPEEVLGPLAAGTVGNARDAGGGAATLTGPVVRGEADTVRKHLDAMSAVPELAGRYREVARMILAAAEGAGKLDDKARRAFEGLI